MPCRLTERMSERLLELVNQAGEYNCDIHTEGI